MSTNKYRRRRAMRKPTAGVKYQNEPLQGPIQQTNQGSSFDALGREDARRITEANNPNTRYIDKPEASTSRRQMMDAMTRQQTAIRDAQRQVLGKKAVKPLKPSGNFNAPSVPSQSPIVFKGGSVHFQPRVNLVIAVAGVASQMLVEPPSDAISDKIIFPLWKSIGQGYPNCAEIRERQELERQNPQQVGSTTDAALIDALPQTSPEASVSPLNPSDECADGIEDSTQLETIVEEAPMLQPHSPSPADDERNREYLIRRAALGDNPTQEEMNAVVAYGLEQHKINFPHLYQ